MLNLKPLHSAQFRVEEAARWLQIAVVAHDNLSLSGEGAMADIDALDEAKSNLSAALATLHDAGLDRAVSEVAVSADGASYAVVSDFAQWPISAQAEKTLRRLGLSLLQSDFRWEDFTEEFIDALVDYIPTTFADALDAEMQADRSFLEDNFPPPVVSEESMNVEPPNLESLGADGTTWLQDVEHRSHANDEQAESEILDQHHREFERLPEQPAEHVHTM